MGEALFNKVQASKVLVVGAGGIGCELLKNLVLTGFSDIETVDLDTIDVSNLNRQFLFRPRHVKMSKSEVAKESVLRFNPDVKMTAYHGNVKTPQFGADFVKKFTLVFNALDNISARKHVNRLCLSTGTALIESGTTGYLGQVTVIKGKETECYECQDKPTPKQHPICTIRSTPSKPVHTLVWAKEFYKLLFGNMEESMIYEPEDGEDESVFMPLVKRPTSFGEEELRKYARDLFVGIYELEMTKQIDMGRYKTADFKPAALLLADIEAGKVLSRPSKGSLKGGKEEKAGMADQRMWPLKECAEVLISSIVKFWMSAERRESVGSAVFDKDDQLSMDFVTASNNLRAHIFGIELQSRYDAKGIAGNIIPAIATTNAIIAGIQVMESLKLLKGASLASDVGLGEKTAREVCSFTWCNRSADRRGTLLIPTPLCKPNSDCYVCGGAKLDLYIDTEATTFEGRRGCAERGCRERVQRAVQRERVQRAGAESGCREWVQRAYIGLYTICASGAS
jgi:ubiquitin-like 1-activating enzyme E1 B